MKKLITSIVLFTVLLMADDAAALVITAALSIALIIALLIKDTSLERKQIAWLFSGALFLNIFLFIYNKKQNFIPFWDYAGYYIETLDAGGLIYENLLSYINSVYESMLYSDYTKLPAFFAAPFLKAFGKSYGAFITVNFNLFLLPFFIVFGILLCKIEKRLLPLMFFFPPFLNPLLRGYIDSVGLVFSATWLYVIYSDGFEEIDSKRNFLLAVLSLIFIFTRRWYLFFLVSMFFSLGLTGILRTIWEKEYNYKNHIINLFSIGSMLLLLVLTFFFPYFIRVVTNNFSDIYSAYMFGDFWWNIKYFIKYYGLLVFSLSGAGAVLGLYSRKTRTFTLFLVIQGITMYILFTRVQTISYHHQYLFAPIMFLLIGIGISVLKGKIKPAMTAAAFFIICAGFVYSYTPYFGENLTGLGFSSKRFEPKTANIENIAALRDRLNELTDKNGGHVYILASSEVLNDDMLRNSRLPYERNALASHYGTAHVDKRDGFPNNLLISKYIVVATPLQVHLGEENQRVIEFFVRQIESGELTKNLEKIDSMPITDEVRADIYERKRGYSVEFLNAAREYFTSAYPNHPILHNIDYVHSQN